MSHPRIPFMDLHLADDAGEIRAAITRVIDSGWFVLGPEVDAFEKEFAALSGAARAIGTGNGTDAIAIALRALGIGPGDEVITTPLSAAYTALAIVMAGARPVFADVDAERLTLDPAAVEQAITPSTAAILPVHLYGQPADMNALAALANRRGLVLIEDCCQAHLATCTGRPVGTFGVAGAFSFYPTKNLGALGDAGAIITNDPALADRMTRIRNGGQTDRYHHLEIGVNSRLDEMQAAILRARLGLLRQRTEQRRALAAEYRRRLSGAPVRVPLEMDPGHVYHLFPVRTTRRSSLRAHLFAAGIETLVHYPVAISRQPAFASANPAECPRAEAAADEVLSLPLHPALPFTDVGAIADAIRKDLAS
jgi:dTDP-4-amino-4,6-dideoxygalactose transaminase